MVHFASINLFESFHLLASLLTIISSLIILASSSLPESFPSSGLDVDVLDRAQRIASGTQSRDLGQCEACRVLVKSFNHGLKETSRAKFEGGDASWEESKLKPYKDSELRLIEIQEKLCEELDSNKPQCQLLAENNEAEIEHWWLKLKNENVELFDYLCIEKLSVCCPPGKFGSDCKECPGYPDNVCSNKGTCKGNGTRKGNGKCKCDSGYFGEMCTKCAVGYFELESDANTGIPDCQPCDKSCHGHCRGKGPKMCEVCKDGFIFDQEYGCLDIDECLELGHNPCKGNTFCVNTEGSYQCYQCDKSCDGCNGDGPDMCKKCATNYAIKDGLCIDTKVDDRESQMEMSRYATYLGLTVAICIIFRKNIYIASAIGLAVAVYIGLAEYTVREAASKRFPNTMFEQKS